MFKFAKFIITNADLIEFISDLLEFVIDVLF